MTRSAEKSKWLGGVVLIATALWARDAVAVDATLKSELQCNLFAAASLTHTGYRPDITACLSCVKQPEKWFRFHPLVEQCGDAPKEGRKRDVITKSIVVLDKFIPTVCPQTCDPSENWNGYAKMVSLNKNFPYYSCSCVGKAAPAAAATPASSPPVIRESCAPPAGSKIALRSDSNGWFSRCNGCQKTNGISDTITTHAMDPAAVAAYIQFEVVDAGGGKIALKSDTGKYVSRCNGCVPGGRPDVVTVHATGSPPPGSAQFKLEQLPNGKCAIKADTGKYLGRCNGCSPGASYPDTVTIDVTDPKSAPHAQWDIVDVN